MCLTEQGVKVMISNSNTDFIRDLYSDLNIQEITTKYAINQKNTTELVITNYPKKEII